MAKSRKRSESDTPASTSQSAAQSSTAATAPQPEPSAESTPSQSRQSAQPSQQNSRSGDDYRERVAQRAYELYLSRGGAHGSDWEDWLAAERELIANRGEEEPKE